MEYVDVGLFFDPEDQGVMKIVSQRINVMHPPPPPISPIHTSLSLSLSDMPTSHGEPGFFSNNNNNNFSL